ncbi:hypothetical protein [Frankia sp. Cj5]|uniref:hypothetical protein n=1 Tax=Frankia sp. Cj5 TaxID=2880978 RepID=UPI001EF73820|nr:hypothetical protein [Frankia sp. Cj5]
MQARGSATPRCCRWGLPDLYAEDGVLNGTAHGSGEEAALSDVLFAGDRLTWSQSITKPLRLNLTFDMVVNGDTMTGKSKAGRLPTSKVTGQRRTA